MRRREFIVALGGGVLAWPLIARAQEQPSGVRRVGWLGVAPLSDPIIQRHVRAFKQAFEHLGWTEGRNLLIDYRWRGGDVDQVPPLAKELVSSAPDVLVVYNTPGLAALRRETQTIPIIFVGVSDPVGQGFVASLAHPGGNITGFTDIDPTMASKRLELLKEIAPGVARVAFIFNPKFPYSVSVLRSIEAAAPSFAVKVTAAPVHDASEIEHAITVAGREPNGGLIVDEDAFNFTHRELIVALAAQHRLPAVYPYRSFFGIGGLLSYGVDFGGLFRQAAVYIDRIFKGAKPADLPVQQPSKFELFVNLKTAKDLGLTVPRSLLVLADEVIE
jgi:putative tryptophan/tyrosine transport system substrate-binding protein